MPAMSSPQQRCWECSPTGRFVDGVRRRSLRSKEMLQLLSAGADPNAPVVRESHFSRSAGSEGGFAAVVEVFAWKAGSRLAPPLVDALIPAPTSRFSAADSRDQSRGGATALLPSAGTRTPSTRHAATMTSSRAPLTVQSSGWTTTWSAR
mmetsp:Transcript_40630/g.115797  ORF Transcript_40630/g.115797 Transcript_40630/m.115797 type:complete len:150 (+) Transcript_40630:77-526(+)